MADSVGTSGKRKVTGKIDLLPSQQTRSGARSSPTTHAYPSPITRSSPTVRPATATPIQPRARARVNLAAVETAGANSPVGSDGSPRQPNAIVGSGGSTLGRRALVRAATTPNASSIGTLHESPGTPTAAGARVYASSSSSSTIGSPGGRSELSSGRARVGGSGYAKVNRGVTDAVSDSRTPSKPPSSSHGAAYRANTWTSLPSTSSSAVAGPSSRPLLPSLPIASPVGLSIADVTSQRSPAREAARIARLNRDNAERGITGDENTSPVASRSAFTRTPSFASDRSSASYHSSGKTSSLGKSSRSPKVFSHDVTPRTEMSSYGSSRDDKALSLEQAISDLSGGPRGTRDVTSSHREGVGTAEDGSDDQLDNESKEAHSGDEGQRDVMAEDAKRDRKIADLEISNKSLMTINRNLEAEAARKNRLILSLKRQLRASMGGEPQPSDLDPDISSSRNPRKSLSGLSDTLDALELGDDDEVAQESLREASALDASLRKANDAIESLIRKGKEAMHKVDGITEGAKGKVLGVLELEEQEQRDGDSYSQDDTEGPPSRQEGQVGNARREDVREESTEEATTEVSQTVP